MKITKWATMIFNKWVIIPYFIWLLGACIASYLNVVIMPKTAVVTLDSRSPLAENARVIGDMTSENKKILVTNLLRINGYYSGWGTLLHLWIPILSVVLVILPFCTPVAWYCWQRAYKKLKQEHETILRDRYEMVRLECIASYATTHIELKKQFDLEMWESPEISALKDHCATLNELLAETNTENDEYKAQVTRLEKNLAKAEGQLIRFKKRQVND